MKTTHRKAATAKRTRRHQHVDPNWLARLTARNDSFTPAEASDLVLPARIAFESLRGGTGEEGDFDTLACALNIAMVYAEGIDPLCERTCIDAQLACVRIGERHARTGRWGLDGPAMQAIPPALDLHDQMIALSNPLQLQRIGAEVLRRMRTGDVLRGAP